MADEDPYEKIVSLTNERDEALEQAREGKQHKARLDALRAQHESLKLDLDRLGAIGREKDAQIKALKVESDNAKQGQREAELQRDELQQELDDALDRLKAAESSQSEHDSAIEALSGEIDGLRTHNRALEDIIRKGREALGG
jgi:chromosome segregation ATPase